MEAKAAYLYRAALQNDRADLFAFLVVENQRGTKEVRTFGSGGFGAVTEGAISGEELFATLAAA